MIGTNHKIQYDPERCVGCQLCYKACFVDVIRWDEQAHRPIFKYIEDCEHCFYCQSVCNQNAILVIPDPESEHLLQHFERYA